MNNRKDVWKLHKIVIFILVNHNVFNPLKLHVFGTLFLVKTVILIVKQNKNANLGYVKMLNLVIIMIYYVDNLKVIVQSIRLIMVVFRDYNNVPNTLHNINVLVC